MAKLRLTLTVLPVYPAYLSSCLWQPHVSFISSSQTTVTSPGGVQVRYKDTTGAVCETTPGVQSFAGYVDLAEDKHSFFYFFAARNNPETAPITLWLNGSVLSLFAHVNLDADSFGWPDAEDLVQIP